LSRARHILGIGKPPVVPAEIPYCKKKVKKLEENLTNWKSTEVASLLSL